jgi:hypothetical protein
VAGVELGENVGDDRCSACSLHLEQESDFGGCVGATVKLRGVGRAAQLARSGLLRQSVFDDGRLYDGFQVIAGVSRCLGASTSQRGEVVGVRCVPEGHLHVADLGLHAA